MNHLVLQDQRIGSPQKMPHAHITDTDGKNVFQIYLAETDEIAPAILACMQSVEEGVAGYSYSRYDRARLRSFIQENFSASVLTAYDALRPYAYKADLGRYCLLYHFGGWYIDATVTLQSQLPNTHAYEHVFFEDAPRIDLAPRETAIGLLFARAGSEVLARAIALIVENAESRNFGHGPLDPTGPGLFGRALGLCAGEYTALSGRYMPLTPLHPRKNYAFVLPDGTILAWGKVSHGTAAFDGLRAFHAAGTNSYNVLWERGLVYSEPYAPRRYWQAASHVIRTLLRRIRRKLGSAKSQE